MTTQPDYPTFAKTYNTGAAQVIWTSVIADLETPVSAMLKLAEGRANSFLLESVSGGSIRGRYSFIGLKPDLIWRCRGNEVEINRNARANADLFEKNEGAYMSMGETAENLAEKYQIPREEHDDFLTAFHKRIHSKDKKEFGSPYLNSVSIPAKVLSHSKEQKIVVFKMKRRKGYQKKNGHKQPYTLLEIGKFKSIKTKKTAAKSTKSTETAKKAAKKKPTATKKTTTKKKDKE